MLNRQFFGRLDFLRRVEVGGENEDGVFTLGDDAGGERGFVESFTLGSCTLDGEVEEVFCGREGEDCSGGTTGVGIGSIRCN